MQKNDNGEKSEAITIKTIEKICKRYGFTYVPEKRTYANGGIEVRPFVKIGSELVPVRFDADGVLVKKRRHKFLEAARRANAGFRKDYPPAFPYSRALRFNPEAGGSTPYCPKLERGFFKRYSLAELEKAQSILDAAMEERRRDDERIAKAKKAKEAVEALKTLIAFSGALNTETVAVLKNELERLQSTLEKE